MYSTEAVFNCADNLTPDVAAMLVGIAEHYAAHPEMECAGKRVRLDSLIGILSVPCRRGDALAILAEGEDAPAAAEAIAKALEGR